MDIKRSTLKIRARGQVTIPKEWIQQLGATEGDVFVGVFEPMIGGRITLEFQPTTRVSFADALEKYVIADLAAEGLSPTEIERMLPERKARLEERYAKYLQDSKKSGDYVRGTDWTTDLE